MQQGTAFVKIISATLDLPTREKVFCTISLANETGYLPNSIQKTKYVQNDKKSTLFDFETIFEYFIDASITKLSIQVRSKSKIMGSHLIGECEVLVEDILTYSKMERRYPISRAKVDRGTLVLIHSFKTDLEEDRRSMEGINSTHKNFDVEQNTQRLQKSFHISPNEQLIDCITASDNLNQGTLYITSDHLFFQSNMGKKWQMNLGDVTQLKKLPASRIRITSLQEDHALLIPSNRSDVLDLIASVRNRRTPQEKVEIENSPDEDSQDRMPPQSESRPSHIDGTRQPNLQHENSRNSNLNDSTDSDSSVHFRSQSIVIPAAPVAMPAVVPAVVSAPISVAPTSSSMNAAEAKYFPQLLQRLGSDVATAVPVPVNTPQTPFKAHQHAVPAVVPAVIEVIQTPAVEVVQPAVVPVVIPAAQVVPPVVQLEEPAVQVEIPRLIQQEALVQPAVVVPAVIAVSSDSDPVMDSPVPMGNRNLNYGSGSPLPAVEYSRVPTEIPRDVESPEEISDLPLTPVIQLESAQSPLALSKDMIIVSTLPSLLGTEDVLPQEAVPPTRDLLSVENDAIFTPPITPVHLEMFPHVPGSPVPTLALPMDKDDYPLQREVEEELGDFEEKSEIIEEEIVRESPGNFRELENQSPESLGFQKLAEVESEVSLVHAFVPEEKVKDFPKVPKVTAVPRNPDPKLVLAEGRQYLDVVMEPLRQRLGDNGVVMVTLGILGIIVALFMSPYYRDSMPSIPSDVSML